jgi:hypothetical protein
MMQRGLNRAPRESFSSTRDVPGWLAAGAHDKTQIRGQDMRRDAWVVWMVALVMVVGMAGCVAGAELRAGSASAGGAPPPTEEGGGEPMSAAGGPIEAGCSFNGTQLQGEVGSEFEVACPANCEAEGAAWGSQLYTLDSGVCRAGIHAGAIPPSGGVVQVRIEPGRPAYRGSTRNGIQSHDYGAYRLSFAVLNAQAAADAPATEEPGSQLIEAGCGYNGTQIVGDVGTRVVVSCPSGCAATGAVWGSQLYTLDSGVCRAGIHAGLITDEGGEIGVIIEPGRPAYRGSKKNGIESHDYGNYAKSFRVERP